MRKGLSAAVLVLALGLGTSTLAAQESRMIELSVPGSSSRGESVEMRVKTGSLPPGARVILMNEQGDILGGITQFGPSGERNSPVLLPRTAVIDGRVRLRVQVIEPGSPPRSPRPGEVEVLPAESK
jgi:hypothetical protein